MKTCTVEGCERPHNARGLCQMHYSRLRRYGDPLRVGTNRKQYPLKVCSVGECGRAGPTKRGMCPKHYQRWMTYGTTHRTTVAERLVAGLVRMPNGCLEWTGRMSFGYGRIKTEGKDVATHRLAWTLANGPIPAGLFVCHTCDNRSCCDVAHLWLGTAADNNADMIAKGRAVAPYAGKTHCPRGHPYDEANTYVRPDGNRKCRACKAISARRRYSQRKAQTVSTT